MSFLDIIDPAKFAVLCQYYYALGAGAKGMHIEHNAIQALYELFGPSLDTEDLSEWEQDANYILDLFNVVGRVAEQKAIDDASPIIREDHLRQAARNVKTSVKGCKYC